MFVKPWSKDAERCFRDLVKWRNAYVDDIKFTRNLGRTHPELTDKNNGFIDIGRIDKTNRSVVTLRKHVSLIPIESSSSRSRNLKFRFYKIF